MGEQHQRLAVLVGEQEAGKLVAETLVALPEQPGRQAVLDLILHLRGASEATTHLLASIQDMWAIIDDLTNTFGVEGAHKMIHAPVFPDEKQPASSARVATR